MTHRTGMSLTFIVWLEFTSSLGHLLRAFRLIAEKPLSWKDGNRHPTFREHMFAFGYDLLEMVRRPLDWFINRRWLTGVVFWPSDSERAYMRKQLTFVFRHFGRNTPRVSTPVMRGI